MFNKFLKKNGIAIVASMIILVVFMAGVLCGLLICLKYVESAEHTSGNNIVAEIEEKPQKDEPAVAAVSSPVNMGKFTLTAYCPCKSCSGEWGTKTSTGTTAKEGRTVAVDPSVIPYGSTIIINGVEYVAEDCGGLIKGNKIDIYFECHNEANQFGVQTAEVFLKI